jgi:hypothetical protein
MKVDFLQFPSNPARLLQGVNAERVEHEYHIVPNCLAYRATNFQIFLREPRQLWRRFVRVGVVADVGVNLVCCKALLLASKRVLRIHLRAA